MQRKMIIIPLLVIALILYFTVFGERGLLRIYHLDKERREVQARLDTVKNENLKLVREVDALKNDRRYLESIARRDFGMVRKNEIIYQFPTQKPAVVSDQEKK
jgi:cell division protein FtsB